MSTGRSSVVTSSRTSGYSRAKPAASFPSAVWEKSRGALIRNLPRGRCPPEAMAAAVWSSSVSSWAVRSNSARPSSVSFSARAPRSNRRSSRLASQLRDAARQRRLRTPGGARGFSEPSVTSDQVEVGEGKKVHLFHQRDDLSKISDYRRECGSLTQGQPNGSTQERHHDHPRDRRDRQCRQERRRTTREPWRPGARPGS